MLKKAIQKVQLLQTRVNFVIIKLEDGIEQIENYREDLSASLSDRETVNLWEPVAFRRPLREIYYLSKEKARLVFSFYSKNNSGRIVFLLLLIAGLTLFLRNLKKKLHAAQSSPTGQQEWLVFTLSSFVIGTYCLMCFPIYLPSPAICFQHAVLWIISVAVSYIHFPEFHYEILEVCMAHTGADVFPGSY